MKVTFKFLYPFNGWAGAEMLDLEFQPGETLGEITNKWLDANPELKENFVKHNAYKENRLYAHYMCDSKFYKAPHVPEDGQLYTVMSTMMGG